MRLMSCQISDPLLHELENLALGDCLVLECKDGTEFIVVHRKALEGVVVLTEPVMVKEPGHA